jgi:hypothetical protein
VKRSRGRGRRPQNNHTHSHTHNHNRAFDSAGPDIKIRGTAANIYEKYLQMARDAGLAGDRVAQENYLQHAEHYYRILMVNQAQHQQQNQNQNQQYSQGNPQNPTPNGGQGQQQGGQGQQQASQGQQQGGDRHNPNAAEPYTPPGSSTPSFTLSDEDDDSDEGEGEGDEAASQ